MVKMKAVDIIAPAALIPDGSRVRKVTGTTVFILRKELQIHVERDHFGEHNPIQLKGCFLICDGEVSNVSECKHLVWIGQDITVHQEADQTDEDDDDDK